MKTLAEAFHHTLQDIYYAEAAMVKAMQRMIEAVPDAAIRQAFSDHLVETREQITILQQVFASIDAPARGERCDAVEGLIKETEDLMQQASGKALNALLIGAAQAVEHYEIARYGTLRQWAQELGNAEAHGLLSQILDMEKAANAKLTGIAVAMAK
jgi:ferritin-like metal-binding protein YciE